MYTNNKDIYHFLLDLKLGLPVAIKTDFGNYILLTSSDSVTNETLELIKNISASKISIIINKRRMNYLSKKDIDGELFSISCLFQNKYTSERILSKKYSSSTQTVCLCMSEVLLK